MKDERDVVAAKLAELCRRWPACAERPYRFGFCRRHWTAISPADRVAALQGDRLTLNRLYDDALGEELDDY